MNEWTKPRQRFTNAVTKSPVVMRPYESDLDTITPEIQTPRAVGQYQHGSARWMTDSEKDKAFDSYILDPHDPTIRQLLETGYDGLDFLKEK